MNAAVFLDTNIFLYAIDEDLRSADKRKCAEQLVLSESWGWSVQVAAEFYVNSTSPKRPFGLSAGHAAALVETWFFFPTVDITPSLFRAAVKLKQRFQLSYWDAAILAAAKQLGCAVVSSEDLNSGQHYDGVTVVNPFATSVGPELPRPE